MSGLRLRPQQTPSSVRVGDDTTHASSCSTDRKFTLSPQSFNAILHPPLRNSCPAKMPPFYGKDTLSSKMRRRCTLRLNLTRVFYLGVALSIGFILGLQFVALQSIGDGSNNDNSEYNSKSMVPNPKYNVRRRVERRHPRIAYHVVQSESSAINHGSTTSLWKMLLSSFASREKHIIDDPMLHHDGWSATSTTDEQNGGIFNENHGECIPMAGWQATSYPNCNSIHEIDMVLSSGKGSIAFPPINNMVTTAATTTTTMRRRWLAQHPWQHFNGEDDPHRKNSVRSATMGMIKQEDITFLGQGWFRAAWRMDVDGLEEYDDDEEDYYQKESVVLKTLRYEREFLEEYYELHRRDALAMERLTASPYVLDVYGYCGQSAINELANFGIEGMSSLEKVARGFRGLDIEPVSKIKLQLAAMVAQGVSHLHSIDHPDFVRDGYPDRSATGHKPRASSNATLVHYDLNPRNIAIVKRGKPKLNDFNVAEFLMWNPKTNTKCGFEGRFKEPWWRAPEEMQVQMVEYSNPPPLTEKVDVYSLGNILYELLTTHSPWGKMMKERQDEVRPKVARGELPKLPPPYDTLTLKDPALKALKDAMYKCLRLNPEDRPSAGEIAEELAEALGNLPEGYGDKSKFKEEIEKFDKKKDKEKKKKKHDSQIAKSEHSRDKYVVESE
jgi:serine/threonine protein kinase